MERRNEKEDQSRTSCRIHEHSRLLRPFDEPVASIMEGGNDDNNPAAHCSGRVWHKRVPGEITTYEIC